MFGNSKPIPTPPRDRVRARGHEQKKIIKGAPDSLEQSFLDMMPTGQIALSAGVKKSGKSVMALCYLKYSLDNNVYQQYYLCLPNYTLEEKGSYDFIKKYKGSAQVYVFSQWDEEVIKRIMRQMPRIKKFLLSDDMTSYMKLNASQLENQFMASIRHYGCSAWLIFHLLKGGSGGLSSSYRQNIDHLFIYLNVNRKGLEDLYMEYLSLVFPTFQDFMKYYKNKILSTPFNSLYVYTRLIGEHDADVVKWNLLTLKNEIISKE